MKSDRWRRTTLGQITGGRGALRAGPFGCQLHASDYVAAGIPVVMPRDFAYGSIRGDDLARVTQKKAEQMAGFRIRANDVLLARRGEMGRCALVEASQDGWLCGTGVLRIRPNDRLDGGFLTHFLRHSVTVSWLEDHAVGQTLTALNVRTLAELPMLLPPIGEQQRIAAILGVVEQAVESAQRVVGHGARMRQSFWRRMLTRGPRRNSSLVGGMDPRKWQRRTIGSLCTISNGFPFRSADRSTEGLPIIRIKNLNGSGIFHYFGGRPAREWIVNEGDLLFAWAGAKGSSFGACLWPGPRGVLNQHIFRVRPNPQVGKEWLFETLKHVTAAIEEKAHGFKSDLLHVRKAEVTQHLVSVPPIEAQRWLGTVSQTLSSIAATESKSLAALIRLKRGLAFELLTGRSLGISH